MHPYQYLVSVLLNIICLGYGCIEIWKHYVKVGCVDLVKSGVKVAVCISTPHVMLIMKIQSMSDDELNCKNNFLKKIHLVKNGLSCKARLCVQKSMRFSFKSALFVPPWIL